MLGNKLKKDSNESPEQYFTRIEEKLYELRSLQHILPGKDKIYVRFCTKDVNYSEDFEKFTYTFEQADFDVAQSGLEIVLKKKSKLDSLAHDGMNLPDRNKSQHLLMSH